MTMKISDLELKESVLTELSENDASKICGGADMFSIGGSAAAAAPAAAAAAPAQEVVRLQEALVAQQTNSEQAQNNLLQQFQSLGS
jgi:hypothetical protein